MKRTVFSVFKILRQIRRFKRFATWFLSDSGKGEKEYFGRIVSLRKSARGISLRLDSGKIVAWKLPSDKAAFVMGAL